MEQINDRQEESNFSHLESWAAALKSLCATLGFKQRLIQLMIMLSLVCIHTKSGVCWNTRCECMLNILGEAAQLSLKETLDLYGGDNDSTWKVLINNCKQQSGRANCFPLTHLHEFPRQLVSEKFLLLLIVDRQRLLLLLEGLDLLEQGVADEFLLLFSSGLLQGRRRGNDGGKGKREQSLSKSGTSNRWYTLFLLPWLNCAAHGHQSAKTTAEDPASQRGSRVHPIKWFCSNGWLTVRARAKHEGTEEMCWASYNS